jgi:hypothetical protein
MFCFVAYGPETATYDINTGGAGLPRRSRTWIKRRLRYSDEPSDIDFRHVRRPLLIMPSTNSQAFD